jgi:hypothetical protein
MMHGQQNIKVITYMNGETVQITEESTARDAVD